MSEFERGLKEGRTDALLSEHGAHLARIDVALEQLVEGIADQTSELRKVNEKMTLAAERVQVAADTLATETERRRAELAVAATASEASESSADRKFSKREKLAALAIAIVVPIAVAFLVVLLSRYKGG